MQLECLSSVVVSEVTLWRSGLSSRLVVISILSRSPSGVRSTQCNLALSSEYFVLVLEIRRTCAIVFWTPADIFRPVLSIVSLQFMCAERAWERPCSLVNCFLDVQRINLTHPATGDSITTSYNLVKGLERCFLFLLFWSLYYDRPIPGKKHCELLICAIWVNNIDHSFYIEESQWLTGLFMSGQRIIIELSK